MGRVFVSLANTAMASLAGGAWLLLTPGVQHHVTLCLASLSHAACLRYFPAQQSPHPELGCEVLDSQHFRLAPQPGGSQWASTKHVNV